MGAPLAAVAGLLDQTKQWQEVFGGGPLAAFLGLVIIFAMGAVVAYLRSNRALLAEKDHHAETIRATTTLIGAMERAWNDQLRAQGEAIQQREKELETRARELDTQNRSLAVLERAVSLAEKRV